MTRCVVLALALLALSPGTASADSLAVFSDPGDFLGQGQQDVFEDVTLEVDEDALAGGADHVQVTARSAELGSWQFVFAAPYGQALRPYAYVGAERSGFQDTPGVAGLDITADFQRGCNDMYGHFEVRDLVRRADGSVRRLWVVFVAYCEGRLPAVFGEVRVGDVPGPAVLRWPELDAFQAATPVQLGPALADAAPTGSHPQDFLVRDGAVQFRPTAPGVRTATLRAADGREVVLEGFAHGGTSKVVVEDVINGRTYTHTPATSQYSGSYYPETDLASMYVVDGERADWTGSFHPGTAGWQIGRTYTGANFGTGPRTEPSMEVFGSNRPCNGSSGGSFTLRDLSREPDGNLRTLDVEFQQNCYDPPQPALRGRFQYRAGDRSPYAPWLTPGPREGLPSLPPEDGGATTPPPSGGGTTTTPPPSGGGTTTTPPPSGGGTSATPTTPPPSGGGTSTTPTTPPPDGGGTSTMSSSAATTATPPTTAGTPTATAPPPQGPLGATSVTAAPTSGATAPAGPAPAPLSAAASRRATAACARAVRRLVRGTRRADRLTGSARADRLVAGEGRDALVGRGGDDCLHGGAGPDRLDGGGGADRLFGGAGDDLLTGGPGADALDCGPGRRDRAVVGPGDRVRGCEQVVRAAR